MFSPIFLLRLLIRIIHKRSYPATLWGDYIRLSSWYFLREDGRDLYILNEQWLSTDELPQSITIKADQKVLFGKEYKFIMTLLDQELDGEPSKNVEGTQTEEATEETGVTAPVIIPEVTAAHIEDDTNNVIDNDVTQAHIAGDETDTVVLD